MNKKKQHNYKFILGLIIGGIVFGTLGTIAANQIASSNVTYTNNGQSTVYGALDDLFSKVGKCPDGYVCGWQPKYFAFGTPTTSSTTDYTTIGKKVFAALDANGNKGVCIIRNNNLICFKSKNYDNDQVYVKQVFSDSSCTFILSSMSCYADDFNCGIFSNGDVVCIDKSTNAACTVYSRGDVGCS